MDFQDEGSKKRIKLIVAIALVVSFCVALGGVLYHLTSGKIALFRCASISRLYPCELKLVSQSAEFGI